MEGKALVSVVMGSDSDYPAMASCLEQLEQFGIPHEVRVLSAHRSPEKVSDFAAEAEKNGLKVIIAAAGGAAHLAGVIASQTILPVVGVPMTSTLDGMDSLLSIVQMPSGIPVATVSIGKAGARNAAILAAQLLALSDEKLNSRLKEFKKELALKVEKKNQLIQEKRSA